MEYDGKIYFGIGNKETLRSIEATAENVDLVKKLEHSCDVQDIAADKLQEFMRLGLLTDNEYQDYKYSRNINFFEWIDLSENTNPQIYQDKLMRSAIMIVGIGGIGSTIAEILARCGVGELILVDYDSIEESNITRQSGYFERDIGSKKTCVLAKNVSQISKKLKIEVIDSRIESKQDLEQLYSVNSFDLAICCADKPRIEIDLWFDQVSHECGRPFIIGSYASTVINRTCIVPGKTIRLADFYKKYAISDESMYDSFEQTSVIAPISYMAAGMISYKAVNMLTGLNDTFTSVQIDLLDWSVSEIDISKQV